MSTAPEVGAIEALTEAVQSGAGLPEVVRAAARALDASLVVVDRAGQVLAVAARSPAEEQSILAGGPEIEILELRLGGEPVGELRLRARSEDPSELTGVIGLLIAGEAERSRAPHRASADAAEAFVAALLAGRTEDPSAVGLELDAGASVLVARARAHAPGGGGWRGRVLGVVARGARAAAGGAPCALSNRSEVPGAEVVVIVPGGEEAIAARAAEGVLRELDAALPGHRFSLGRSRGAAADELHRATREAILAANVAEGDPERPVLAFD